MLKGGGALLQSLTGLIGLLNSPFFVGNGGESSGSHITAEIMDAAVKGIKQVHWSCGKPVQKVSLTLEDFFEDQDLPSEAAVDNKSPSEEQTDAGHWLCNPWLLLKQPNLLDIFSLSQGSLSGVS